jgi:raffinose/stachyose/melibiose transport system permease protein
MPCCSWFDIRPSEEEAERMSSVSVDAQRSSQTQEPNEWRKKLTLRNHHIISKILMAVIIVIQVYPLLWLFITSIRTEHDFTTGDPFGIPKAITFDNFIRAFQTGNLWLNILNSIIVTFGADILIVILGMMGAYALNVLGFKFSGLVRMLFLMGIIVPVQIALVPLFIDYSQIGLLDTYESMIIPLAGFALPMSIFLFGSFYEYIPRETYEAASLDGAGPYRIFAQITLPLSLNTIVTVVLVNSIFIWNDFIFGNTFVLSDGLKTIPLGLQNYVGAMGNTDWTATFAAVCVSILPLLLVFLALNKTMIQGLESGATKG